MFYEYPDVLDVIDVCTMLKISKKKVYQLLHDNIITNRKIGRIYRIPKQAVILFISTENTTTEKGEIK